MLKRFLSSSNANAPMEAVIVIPFMIWGFVLMATMTDAYVKRYKVVQSTYGIADAISRETEFVNANDIDGLNILHEQMTASPNPTATRVTLIHYDADLGQIELDWSYATTGVAAHTSATVADISAQVPTLSHGEAMIFVETWRDYAPVFGDLIGEIDMDHAAFAKLRYTPTLAWQGS